MMRQRHRVAEFWDGVIDRVIDGDLPNVPPLDRWMQAYRGAGEGLVDFEAMPEPYHGRILSDDIRAVMLGLNPGGLVESCQRRDGAFAVDIKAAGGYRRWKERGLSPEARRAWEAAVGKIVHFTSRVRLARQWNRDDSLQEEHILTFELYPWHSRKVIGHMNPDPEIIHEFVLAPIGETGVRHAWAFGAPWFRVLDELGLERVVTLGKGGEPYPTRVASRTVGIYASPSGNLIVVEKHSGSAGPPSREETEILRTALEQRGLA